MKDRDILPVLEGLKPLDLLADGELTRIAARRQHDTGARPLVPATARLGEAPFHRVIQQRHQIVLQQRQNRLQLRIAKAHVELQDLRAFGGDDQPGVEHPLKRDPLGDQPLQRRLDDLFHHVLRHRLGHDRRRSVGAHPAGVGTFVVIQQALVVLGGRQRHRRDAVGDDEERCFLPLQFFFDDDPLAGLLEDPVLHQQINGPQGFAERVGDDGAFAAAQAIRLDDDRGAQLAHVSARGLRIIEHRETGCRHVILLHEILGEGLAGFQACRPLGGAEDPQAPLLEDIDDALRQRPLRADDRQIHVSRFGKLRQRLEILGADIHQLGQLADAAVARRAVERVHLRRLAQLPEQCVLPSPRSHHQHLHGMSLLVFWMIVPISQD